MKISILADSFSVLKYEKLPQNLAGTHFTAVTDDEVSVLCKSDLAPENYINKEDGFRGLKIEGTLDFSLIGIISRITPILADNDISVFVVSTFNTDYIFLKEENLTVSCQLLFDSGYDII